MSHFSVLIALPGDTDPTKIEDEIGTRMERWDENREVGRFKDFESGGPAEFWYVSSLRKAAEHHQNGTGIRPTEPDFLGISSVRTSKTADEQREEYARRAKLAERLGDNPTWETIVEIYNEEFHPRTQLAVPGEEDDDPDEGRLHYDRETGQAYTWSTRNPDSKWDYWRVGGRWGNGYFVARPGYPGLIQAHKGWDSPDTRQPGYRADGGRVGSLDLATMRDEATAKAEREYATWEGIVESTPPARTRAEVFDAAEIEHPDEDRITTRKRWEDQPRVQAAVSAGLVDKHLWDDPIEQFLPPREEYVTRARNAAVPGYALVTKEGEWWAVGEMGWFGMGSDDDTSRALAHAKMNEYLDSLSDDDFLIVLDCHI